MRSPASPPGAAPGLAVPARFGSDRASSSCACAAVSRVAVWPAPCRGGIAGGPWALSGRGGDVGPGHAGHGAPVAADQPGRLPAPPPGHM